MKKITTTLPIITRQNDAGLTLTKRATAGLWVTAGTDDRHWRRNRYRFILGAGARLQMAGPSLAIVYLVCGIFSFFILRALGELVLHRPSSGSFVSYAREFTGEKAAFVAGWMYFVNWAMTGIVDITAVALYMHYWGAFGDVPQWVFALGAGDRRHHERSA